MRVDCVAHQSHPTGAVAVGPLHQRRVGRHDRHAEVDVLVLEAEVEGRRDDVVLALPLDHAHDPALERSRAEEVAAAKKPAAKKTKKRAPAKRRASAAATTTTGKKSDPVKPVPRKRRRRTRS